MPKITVTDLGFDIISVKQMSTTRRSPSEGTLSKETHPIPHYFALNGEVPRETWKSGILR
jgi:hypothetical protein